MDKKTTAPAAFAPNPATATAGSDWSFPWLVRRAEAEYGLSFTKTAPQPISSEHPKPVAATNEK